ncbi:hypothetical protein T492DRAFT_964238 [Pavlovales sp. CCMP2436]|nr:hypothetical protein T492DRAFT_964238 [Pavlovales sp. CCMP2436]
MQRLILLAFAAQAAAFQAPARLASLRRTATVTMVERFDYDGIFGGTSPLIRLGGAPLEQPDPSTFIVKRPKKDFSPKAPPPPPAARQAKVMTSKAAPAIAVGRVAATSPLDALGGLKGGLFGALEGLKPVPKVAKIAAVAAKPAAAKPGGFSLPAFSPFDLVKNKLKPAPKVAAAKPAATKSGFSLPAFSPLDVLNKLKK